MIARNHSRVSLIVPVKDEEQTIEELLQSIHGQSRKFDEVIITDGGSKDKTREIIQSYIRMGYPIKLLCEEHAYPGKGRNIAAEASTCDIIAFTDAGIRLDHYWLEKLMEPIEKDSTVDVVYGNYEPITDSFFKECAALVYVPPRELINGKVMRHHFIASSLMKKGVWRAVGGFPDFRAAEDRIFMEKIHKAGYKVEYAPAALVYWHIKPDLRSTFKRFFLYSYHDIVSGRARDWHYSVIRIYLIGISILLLGLLHNLGWLLLLVIAFFTRVAKSMVRRRLEAGKKEIFNPLKLGLVSLVMLTIDLAMFLGIVKWITIRYFKIKRS